MLLAEKLLSPFLAFGHELKNKQTKTLQKVENSHTEELTVADSRIRAFVSSVAGGIN